MAAQNFDIAVVGHLSIDTILLPSRSAPFVILGGTGRFEGATGGGMTDDYNSSEDPYSHHQWVGKITLVKGKR